MHLLAALVPAGALAVGCTSFAANDEATEPIADASSDVARPIEEAGVVSPDAGPPLEDGGVDADVSGPQLCPDGSNPLALQLLASADTTFASECNTNTSRGSDPILDLGKENGAGVGLLRFDVDPQNAVLLGAAKIVGGRLRLFANPNCNVCSSPIPTKQGQLFVHAMRPDWDEGGSGGNKSGADLCRRAAGSGWGASGSPGIDTKIAIGVDFDDGADTTAVPENADEVTLFLGADTITARASINAKQIAFLLRMPNGGRMAVATREKSAAEAAELVVHYCQ